MYFVVDAVYQETKAVSLYEKKKKWLWIFTERVS